MKRSLSLRAHTPWPPLLWVSLEPAKSVVNRLSQHGISVHDYIISELENARNSFFNTIHHKTGILEEDTKNIIAIANLVRSYDKAATSKSLSKASYDTPYVKKQLPALLTLINEAQLPTDFMVEYDENSQFDVVYDRPIETMIFSDGPFMRLADPQDGTLPPASLTVGPSYFYYGGNERYGCLAREILGHATFEYATQRHVLFQLLKRYAITNTLCRTLTIEFMILNEIEADIRAAMHSQMMAECVLLFLHAQSHYRTYHKEERIRNIETILNLFREEKMLSQNQQ